MKENCIFCKIIKGEIPSCTLYEDDHFKIILDRFPASKGHLLILTKEHYQDIFELEGEALQNMYKMAKRMSEVVVKALGADGVNIVQNNKEVAGQEVLHFHLHVIPRFKDDNVVLFKTRNMDITVEELEEIANKIKSVM